MTQRVASREQARKLRLVGKDATEARELAVDLIASLQGAFLLAYSFRPPAHLERQFERQQTWIESL